MGLAGIKSMGNKPLLTPEILVPRLGDYLVEKNLISIQELRKALEHQEKLRSSGLETPLLGQILVEMDIISQAALSQAITEQIIQLRNALQDANEQLERRVQQRTAELETALRKLSELNQLKTNFIANISHELRTPLTHIKGYLEIILAGDLGTIDEEQEHALQIMVRSADRLGKLIEDLIEFSVSERGQLNLQLQPVRIQDLCHRASEQAVQKANENNLNLVNKSQENLPYVEVDAEKISWVISQLLDNAIKFTQPGGTIILSAVRLENFVQVTISDTGMGIPDEKKDTIFEPFIQLDGSSTRRAGGTGLGLALAQKIVEAHGSQLYVSSNVGKGSEFSFLLKVTPIPEFDILLKSQDYYSGGQS
jgi:signal transduction histidine kinase